MNEQPPRPDWDRIDDPTLLGLLGAALRRHETPPPAVVTMAKAGFGLHRLDVELAALVADSLDAATGPRVRSAGGPRLVGFECGDLALELEAVPDGAAWRIVGQLDPPGPARIELRRPAPDGPAGPGTPGAGPGTPGPVVATEADPRGRFALDVPGPGPVSLLCRREGRPDVATAWILLAS